MFLGIDLGDPELTASVVKSAFDKGLIIETLCFSRPSAQTSSPPHHHRHRAFAWLRHNTKIGSRVPGAEERLTPLSPLSHHYPL